MFGASFSLTERLAPVPTAKSRPSTPVLDADRNTLLSLQDLADYQPRNAANSIANLQKLETELTQAEQNVLRLRVALDTARARLVEKSQLFHAQILTAKDEVIVQYGSDSEEVQAIGLKRKSAYRRSTRRSQPSGEGE